MTCKIEKKLTELGITLLEEKETVASFLSAVKVNNLLFISGQDCSVNGEFVYRGKVGSEYMLKEGQEIAKQCVINAFGNQKRGSRI